MNVGLDGILAEEASTILSEVSQIYNNQSRRFYSTGELLFEEAFGTNNRLAITLNDCSTPNSTYLQAKTSSGTYSNFSSCSLTDYTISGDNVTIKLISSSNNFFTPLILGDVSFTASTTSSGTSPSQDEGGSTGTSSAFSSTYCSTDASATIYVEAALSESFWKTTTDVAEEEWEVEDIVEEEVAEQEKDLLDKILSGIDVTIKKIFARSFVSSLTTQERVKIDVKGSETCLGVANVSDDSAVIQVASNLCTHAQQELLGISESAEFDTNNDTLVDLNVTLDSIENKTARITSWVVYHGVLAEGDIEQLDYQKKSKKFFVFMMTFIALLAVVFVIYRFRKFR